ncbi:MAG: AAA domain-containing protein [Bacteriovoracales bacterium]|nr:AAA domain-containing protein [Bacteriovoracales bacterium]
MSLENKSSPMLKKLAKYYLKCLSYERDSEISVSQKKQYSIPEYVQLLTLPWFDNTFQSIWEEDNVKDLINKVKKGGGNQNIYLGYPLFVRPGSGRGSSKIEPLFLFSFSKSNDDFSSYPLLSEEGPRFNRAGLRGYGELGGNLFDEIIHLQGELGLDQENEYLLEVKELIKRLKNIRPMWPWQGNFDPQNLLQDDISNEIKKGIYNSAILVRGEESKFTKGLEIELSKIFDGNFNRGYSSSVLDFMLTSMATRKDPSNIDIIEPVPLNYEQKKAIESVFKNDLTVITGPPGTGKSQVVTGLLTNASRMGWRTLFTSKNNKAVDVVEQRVNGLAEQPLLLRLGRRDLQNSFAQKLTNILTISPPEDTEGSYKSLEERHRQLLAYLNNLNRKMQEIIKLRNKTDKLDQKIEIIRKKYSQSVLDNAINTQLSKSEKIIINLGKLLKKIDTNKMSIIDRISWLFLRGYREKKLHEYAQECRDFFYKIGFDIEGLRDDIGKLLLESQGWHEEIKILQEYDTLISNFKKCHSFEKLCEQSSKAHFQLTDCDKNLWRHWLLLVNDRMTDKDRQVLGRYTSLLKYIAEENQNRGQIKKSIWREYYSLSGSITSILPAWAITSLSANGRLPLESGTFDLVIIDEASQCDIASALPLLYRAKRAVVLGDPNQLRHITTLSGHQDLQLLEEHGLKGLEHWGYSKNSCFDISAISCRNIITLKEHHRSHPDIIQYSNKHFYNGILRVATKNENLKRFTSTEEPSVEWHHIDGHVKKYKDSGAYNQKEAEEVVNCVKNFLEIHRVNNATIGVVTPFRGQANTIQGLLARSNELSHLDILVDTAHKFQGDEKDILFFSPVVSKGIPNTALSFLKSQGNIFNVAITRAKSHLIVIGDQGECSSSGIDYLSGFVDYTNNLKSKKFIKNLTEDDIINSEYPSSAYNPETVSIWEVKLYKELYKANLRPVPQYREDKYRLDFAIFKGKHKLNIEVDGERYHKDWTGDAVLEDQIRNNRLRELNWTVMRFWVFQIRDDIDYCVRKVKEWHDTAS